MESNVLGKFLVFFFENSYRHLGCCAAQLFSLALAGIAGALMNRCGIFGRSFRCRAYVGFFFGNKM
jgi:hypothetical protein